MALPKITPIHMAIQTVDKMIQELQLHREELVAALPKDKTHKRNQQVKFVNPYTGKSRIVRG